MTLIKVQRLTDPAAEPITLEEAKAHLRVDGSDEDTIIEAMIGAARDYCESYCNRAWATSNWLYVFDALPDADDVIRMPDPATSSILSITYVDADGDEQTVTSSGYTLDAARQQIRTDVDWATDSIDVVVSYAATVASVPKAVRAAMLLILTDLYEVRSASLVGVGITANPAVAALLHPYRVELGV